MGSYPGHGEVVFSIGFFLLHFLHHGSIHYLVCTGWSLYYVHQSRGINFQPWKKAKEINMSLQDEISVKKSQQRHLWGENTDISATFEVAYLSSLYYSHSTFIQPLIDKPFPHHRKVRTSKNIILALRGSHTSG